MHIDPPSIPPTPTGEQYRIYFLDGIGHISMSHEFFADNDDEAIKIAEGWREGRKIELWCRARIVRTWDAG